MLVTIVVIATHTPKLSRPGKCLRSYVAQRIASFAIASFTDVLQTRKPHTIGNHDLVAGQIHGTSRN